MTDEQLKQLRELVAAGEKAMDWPADLYAEEVIYDTREMVRQRVEIGIATRVAAKACSASPKDTASWRSRRWRPTMNLELREKVAQLVMGWQRGRTSHGEPSWLSPAREGEDRKQKKYRGMWPENGLPAYETDIAAAWQVVEKMRERGFGFAIYSSLGVASAVFAVEHAADGPLREAPTAPLAICLAAVAAIESEARNGKA